MEHFLGGIAPLRHWRINPNEKSNKYNSFELTYQSLNGTLPSRKFSILRHLINAKPLFNVYFLMEIYLQWSKRLGPIIDYSHSVMSLVSLNIKSDSNQHTFVLHRLGFSIKRNNYKWSNVHCFLYCPFQYQRTFSGGYI